MKVSKIIENVKELKNGYVVEEERLKQYINDLQTRILQEIVSGREGDDEIIANYPAIDQSSPSNAEVFAPASYERVYAQYCAAEIDLMYEDGDRYINDAAVFADTYRSLKRYWWQTHRQKRNYQYHI